MDVTEANFNTAVIERSHQVPVVVDFWAEWCGPCRQLGPALEKAVAARAPRIELAKIDTDANQRLAQAFRIQSIPAVKAFKDGAIASEFMGAIPPAQIDEFLDALLPAPTEPAVDPQDEAALVAALAEDPSRADVAVPLARLRLAAGDLDGAEDALEGVSANFRADGLSARIELVRASEAGDAGVPPLAPAFAAPTVRHLQALARFEHDAPVSEDRKVISESRSRTLDVDIVERDEIEAFLCELTAQLCGDLQTRDRRGRTIGISVRLSDFSNHSRARTLSAAVSEQAVVEPIALELLRAFLDEHPGRPVRLLGVRVAGLEEAGEETQLALAL